MKPALLCLILFSVCITVSAQSLPVQNSAWTWVNGQPTANTDPIYGTRGSTDIGNNPGSRMQSLGWTDAQGRLWLFGGLYIKTGNYTYVDPDNGLYNDLWLYDPGKNSWTWVSGDAGANKPGVYGNYGGISPRFHPGARRAAVSWTAADGSLWLFGGFGIDVNGRQGWLNDLWTYTNQTGWVWISGDNTINRPGIFGTQNIGTVDTKPGGREGAVSWADANGNLWLFGGKGYAKDTSQGSLNDLWKFNLKSKQWTWVNGSTQANQPGIYGRTGSGNSRTFPGARQYSVAWFDKAGGLVLYGGQGYGATDGTGYLGDLWRFDIAKQYWTWIGGDNTVNSTGSFGTPGIPSGNNKPGSRAAAVAWADNDGGYWLMGGSGYDASSTEGALNDLWEYDPVKQTWTWISGSKQSNGPGIYGILGQPDLKNTPGARIFATGWTDPANTIWLFGGDGYAKADNTGYLNDLWRLQPYKPFGCPSSRTLSNDTNCSIIVNNIDPILTGNQTVLYTFAGATAGSGSGSASGKIFNPGSTTVTYILASDTSRKCAFSVEVDDKTAPVPLQDSLPVLTGDCGVTVANTPKAKDNCAGIINGYTRDSLVYTRPGKYTLTWTYDDGHGNLSMQRQQVVVTGGEGILTPLVASLPDLTGQCSVTVKDKPLASKSCAGLFLGTTSDPLQYNRQGTYIIHWTITDNNNQFVYQQQRVIVKDTTAPKPQRDSLPVISADCAARVTAIPVATDECAGMITATTQDPLYYAKQGTYTINWVYNDGNGNTSTQQQQVIIKIPVMLTPVFPSLPEISGDCSVRITTPPTIPDYCLGSVAGTTSDSLYFDKPGSYTLHWTYVTSRGDTVRQTQAVRVNRLSLSLSTWPNPSSNYFSLQVKSCNSRDKITIRVFDMLGRMVETRQVPPYQSVLIGERYARATYVVQALQGKEITTAKLVKMY